MSLAMSDKDLSELDLALAWKRTKHDQATRWFVEHPYLLGWIESNLTEWLTSIKKDLAQGHPGHDSLLCYVPKPGWMLRPGSVLDYRDEVVLNAILDKFLPAIWRKVQWSQGQKDMAYQLHEPNTDEEWMQRAFNGWEQWTELSLQKLESGAKFTVVADIAGFYDNINLNLLSSRLKSVSPGQIFFENLTARLNRWAKTPGRGIPQGHSASDLLAKLYFEPIDRALSNAGYDHLRYVDDIRIFCDSHLVARNALARLTDLLHSNGLCLQSAKTKIYSSEEARNIFDGVKPIIMGIQKQLKRELEDFYSGEPYITAEDIEELFKKHANEIDAEVFEKVFQERFLLRPSDFNKTLFHYLLTRLGRIRSKIAVSYCILSIKQRPEEMKFVLSYLSSAGTTESERDEILSYMGSADAIYGHQLYQLVKWFYDQRCFPNKLVDLCRDWFFNKNQVPWLRSYSLAVLGEVAESSDLDRILASYESAATKCEKAEIVVALKNMELGRRNAFYGRINRDSDLVSRAIRSLKQGLLDKARTESPSSISI